MTLLSAIHYFTTNYPVTAAQEVAQVQHPAQPVPPMVTVPYKMLAPPAPAEPTVKAVLWFCHFSGSQLEIIAAWHSLFEVWSLLPIGQWKNWDTTSSHDPQIQRQASNLPRSWRHSATRCRYPWWRSLHRRRRCCRLAWPWALSHYGPSSGCYGFFHSPWSLSLVWIRLTFPFCPQQEIKTSMIWYDLNLIWYSPGY